MIFHGPRVTQRRRKFVQYFIEKEKWRGKCTPHLHTHTQNENNIIYFGDFFLDQIIVLAKAFYWIKLNI